MRKITRLSKFILIVVAVCLVSACGAMSNTADIREFIDQAPQIDSLNVLYRKSAVNKWKASACFESPELCVFSEGNDEADLFKNLKIKAKEATEKK